MKALYCLLLLAFFGFAENLSAAFLEFVPQIITQPNGSMIHCFASGDEYYHWLHDANGFTIIQNRQTGYFVYAAKVGDDLIPTGLFPGNDDPSQAGLQPGLKIGAEQYRRQYLNRYKDPSLKSDRVFTNTGNYNNLVIFIRFSNQNEFTEPLSQYATAFNGTGTVSMFEYFQEVSKNQLNISTTFYPNSGGTQILSYQDSHSRRYYQPYSATNAEGYRNDNQYVDREMTLLKNAVESVAAQVIASGINYDHDQDGRIDNVCFIIQGATDGWSDLLWPHRWVLYRYDVRIGDKQVYDFNFQLSEALGVSVLCHEMFHSLGSPDLYRYENDNITPVGPWDLMAHNKTPPQHMSAYMKMKYGKWFTQIPTISTNGTYSLKPLAIDAYAAYKIVSPNSTSEFFVVEYRKATGRFESSLVGSGLIIYRINSSVEGNADGPPDEIYVYRQNGTSRADGNINNATYSSSVGRTELGDQTTPSDFLSNGDAGGIHVYNIGTAGETITFSVELTPSALNPPRELTASLSGRSATLNWQKPMSGSATLSGYKVYKNSTAIATISNPNTLNFTESGLSDGSYQYFVTALYSSPTGESVASNSVTIQVSTEARPDLMITHPTVAPLNIEAGGTVALACNLENRGSADAANSMLRVYLSRDDIFDSGDRQLAVASIDPVSAGGTFAFAVEHVAIPSTTNNGSWLVLFVADADGSVSESIENNNQAAVTLVIGNPVLYPPRNLTARVSLSSVTLTWTEPEAGGGTLAAYCVYRNGIKMATVSDPIIQEFTDTELAPGLYTYFVTAWYSTPEGESSQSNEIAVTVSMDTKPDLVAQDMMLTPSEVWPGGSVDVTCSILNIGSAIAPPNEIRLYLSMDQILDGNDRFLAYGTVDTIAPGGKRLITGSDIILPDNLAAGTWYALLVVDATAVVDETNESNNQTDVMVQVLGQFPDLLITNMVLFPSIITPGSNVRITFNVCNNGPVLASPVKSTFYLSTDEILDPSDLYLSEVSTRILGPKTNTLLYSGFIMSSTCLPGPYFLLGQMDKDQVVTESDEHNNVYIKPIIVAGSNGTDESIMNDRLIIYPIPSHNRITCAFAGSPGEKIRIIILDMLGREVYRAEQSVWDRNSIDLDVSNWSPGQGLVKIQMQDRLLTGRFIIE